MFHELSDTPWASATTLNTLKQRAQILRHIRQFFTDLDILEVETPLLGQAIGTDPHLHFFTTEFCHPDLPVKKTYYLQTSPEFAMKRLLAQGVGSIYQITKAFRNGDKSKLHNPEFTLLEWYRVGFDYHQLMQEMGKLFQALVPHAKLTFLTYTQAFLNFAGFDPLTAKENFVIAYCHRNLSLTKPTEDKDTALQLILSMIIEPKFPHDEFVFVYDFPASQAALSALKPDNPAIAQRFEVYYKGMELANGFQELTQSTEQHQRFLADLKKRETLSYPLPPIDHLFLAALDYGLPFCSGVAVGLDRLVMGMLGLDDISQVITFTHNQA